MESYQKTFIELALSQQALRFGEFTLKSGRLSPYFFNMGHLCDGQTLATLGQCYADAIMKAKLHFDVLFGPAYKGIPLACTSAIGLYQQYQKTVPYAYNRKEAKDHGEMGMIVGAPLKGRVLILDDVITAGTAMRESFEMIKTHGATVAAVVVALDRQEKGQGELSALQEIQQKLDVPAISIINFSQIMEYVNQQNDFVAYREPMVAYRERYGVTL